MAVVVEGSAIAETVVVGFQEEEEVDVEDFPTETTGFRVEEVETSVVVAAVAVGKVKQDGACKCS